MFYWLDVEGFGGILKRPQMGSIDSEFLEDALNKQFHKKCVSKSGPLERDEIFGFEPAIALGGNDENINMVKKFQMDPHLAFLSQLVEIEERRSSSFLTIHFQISPRVSLRLKCQARNYNNLNHQEALVNLQFRTKQILCSW